MCLCLTLEVEAGAAGADPLLGAKLKLKESPAEAKQGKLGSRRHDHAFESVRVWSVQEERGEERTRRKS